jgi:multiple sugar transport system permease protein
MTAGPRRRRFRLRLRYDKSLGLALISPWLVGLLLFKLLPILASLVLSFTDFYLLEPDETRFIGLDNYDRLFNDPAVGYLLFATLAMALAIIPLQLVVSTGLAALLSSPRLRGRTSLRTLFFLPSIIPGVTIAVTVFGFLDPSTGWLNRFVLPALGLGGGGDLYAESIGSFFFTVSALWSIGPGVLIVLGAMSGLDNEITEAAIVDGAGPLARLFRITLPLITPALFFSLVINLIAVFGGVILLDRGSIFSDGSSPFDGYVSFILFNEWELGYAASLAWFFFVIVMVVVVALFVTSRRWVFYADR